VLSSAIQTSKNKLVLHTQDDAVCAATLPAISVKSQETRNVKTELSNSLLPFIKRYGKDLYGGALVFLFGIGAILAGVGYHVGSLSRMGPGFFPVAVGAILVLVGLAIAFSAKSPDAHAEAREDAPAEWRGWICISIGVLLPDMDKQFSVMAGISHASFQQKNYLMVYHLLNSFFALPTPIYKG
jgi:hypothetical protein